MPVELKITVNATEFDFGKLNDIDKRRIRQLLRNKTEPVDDILCDTGESSFMGEYVELPPDYCTV